MLFSHRFWLVLLERQSSEINLGQVEVHSFLAMATMTIFNLLIKKLLELNKFVSVTFLINMSTKKLRMAILLFSSSKFHFVLTIFSMIPSARTFVYMFWVFFKIKSQYVKDSSSS